MKILASDVSFLQAASYSLNYASMIFLKTNKILYKPFFVLKLFELQSARGAFLIILFCFFLYRHIYVVIYISVTIKRHSYQLFINTWPRPECNFRKEFHGKTTLFFIQEGTFVGLVQV